MVRTNHWVHPAVQCKPAVSGSDQLGCYATTDLPEGTVVTVWGGDVVTGEGMKVLSEHLRTHSIQIEDDLYLVPTKPLEPTDHVNHSCAPNCGLRGQVTLVTMRDVVAGEELTFDYAMTDSSPYDEFYCRCGNQHCRGRVSGTDWQLEALQIRYQGYFSAYLATKIQP